MVVDDVPCPQCGKALAKKKVWKGHKFCSPECYHESMRKNENTSCTHCGSLLTLKQIGKGAIFCSRECRDEARRPVCLTCGCRYERPRRGYKSKFCSEQCRKNSPALKAKGEKISISKMGKPRDSETKRKLRLARLNQIGDANLFGGQSYPSYNKSACEFFRSLDARLGTSGLHAENGGEFRDRELGYWYDYYHPGMKVIIEWDEAKHFRRGEYIQKDVARNETIARHRPDHLLIRIRESAPLEIEAVVSMMDKHSSVRR